MVLLRDQDVEGRETDKMITIAERYYRHLYRSKRNPPQGSVENLSKKLSNVNSEDMPKISNEVIERVIRKLRIIKLKSRRDIGRTAEGRRRRIMDYLRIMLNKCLAEGKISQRWTNAKTILIYKKGDPKFE